jgi:hypothetical protein
MRSMDSGLPAWVWDFIIGRHFRVGGTQKGGGSPIGAIYIAYFRQQDTVSELLFGKAIRLWDTSLGWLIRLLVVKPS